MNLNNIKLIVEQNQLLNPICQVAIKTLKKFCANKVDIEINPINKFFLKFN